MIKAVETELRDHRDNLVMLHKRKVN
jgi:hypothetical protein